MLKVRKHLKPDIFQETSLQREKKTNKLNNNNNNKKAKLNLVLGYTNLSDGKLNYTLCLS